MGAEWLGRSQRKGIFYFLVKTGSARAAVEEMEKEKPSSQGWRHEALVWVQAEGAWLVMTQKGG